MIYKKERILLFWISFIFPLIVGAQHLKPGFEKAEYAEMLRIAARQVSNPEMSQAPSPESFQLDYRSPEMGLSNQWELWTNANHVAVISIRGTTKNLVSWLANFYAVMVPAQGELNLEKNFKFKYRLASDEKAAVHTGWLIGTAYLSRDILTKMDSLYTSGTRDLLITGHSQGGGIAYLLTSYFYQLQQQGEIPKDVRIKTYCSAAPKPGNLFYAYEYESITSDGWAFNVVNAADWVPEMPISIQTTSDFNAVNPFVNAVPTIKKQKFFQRIFIMRIYRKLSRLPQKSQSEYQKYLGGTLFRFIRKQLPEFEKPEYFRSADYVRTGRTIVLKPDEHYRTKFPDNPNDLFMHHLFAPYFFLINRYPDNDNQTP